MQNQIYFKSPIGYLLLAASEQGVASISFFDKRPKAPQISLNPHLRLAAKELREYFSGKRLQFSFKLDPRGTDFQKKVWRALAKVGFGKTCSYADIAKRIGSPKAARAVGGANNKNPLPIVVGCHRIVGASGKLIGYAGGLRRKWWLLRHEQEISFLKRNGLEGRKISVVGFSNGPHSRHQLVSRV
jgi:methylated-DNA-[protein]-cysteine S-methyltransferase